MIEDRREAIKKSIELVDAFDTIIIAGKGCEEYFEKNGEKYPYNDKKTLEELLDTFTSWIISCNNHKICEFSCNFTHF